MFGPTVGLLGLWPRGRVFLCGWARGLAVLGHSSEAVVRTANFNLSAIASLGLVPYARFVYEPSLYSRAPITPNYL